MVDIAAKIKASQEKMAKKEQEHAAAREALEAEQNARVTFSRALSDPGPTASNYGAKVTIFDAVKMGDIATIDALVLRKRSVLKETDSSGSRPIHHAARNCKTAVLRHLDQIDPLLMHARNDSGMTVLHFAVQNSQKASSKECLETLRYILDRTHPDAVFAAADTDKSGELSFAELEAAYGHVIGTSVLKRIFDEVDKDKSGEISLSEFKQALETGTLTPLTMVRDSSGSTVCHVACQRGNKIAVQFFHKYVPELMQVRDKEGRLPMHILASQGYKDTLQAITKKDKALLEARCFNNATLIHHAAAGGQEEVILYLLEELGEDFLDEVDRNGANPAHWAARSNKISVLKLICDKKPGLLVAKNRDGKVPRDLCFSDEVRGFLGIQDIGINRTTSDPGPASGIAAQFASLMTKFPGAHTTEKKDDKSNLPPISSAILPPMPAKGENLADMLKKKRTQRM